MADVAVPVFKKRGAKASNVRKRPATPPREQSATDSDSSDIENGAVKRRKKDGLSISKSGPKSIQDLSRSTAFSADRSKTIAINEDATKASSWYTDAALAAKDSPPANTELDSDQARETAEGSYQGASKYSNYIQKNPNAPSRHVGPVKAPTNVRTITVTDFAPDVCKDYKQTGFCGFGDSCKFLHMRENYKQGWQIDKEWESAGKKKDKSGKPDAEEDDLDKEEKMLKDIPFKCIICKLDYKEPIITKCKHYFCMKCAMDRYMKEKKKSCAACGADTGGSFGVAKKLKELLERKRKRADERAQKAGDEVEEDE